MVDVFLANVGKLTQAQETVPMCPDKRNGACLKTMESLYLCITQYHKPMNDIETIQSALRKFNQDRDWDQFHNGKDLAVAIAIEAGELLEAFLWKAPEDAKVEKVREELADVLNYAFQMADRYGLDIKEIMLDKIRKNAEKYPANKAKGNAKKYNEL